MEKKEYKLYFRDSRDRRREIGCFESTEADALTRAYERIHAFCDERGFRIYYSRRWNTPDYSIFDVGSHTEFFHLEPPVPMTAE